MALVSPRRRQRQRRHQQAAAAGLGASGARQTRLDSQSLAATTAIPSTFLSLSFSSEKEMRGAPHRLEVRRTGIRVARLTSDTS